MAHLARPMRVTRHVPSQWEGREQPVECSCGCSSHAAEPTAVWEHQSPAAVLQSVYSLQRSLSAAGAGTQRAEEQSLTLETRWTMPGSQPQVHNYKYLDIQDALQKQQSTSCLVSCAPNSATSIPTPNHSDIVCKLCQAKSKKSHVVSKCKMLFSFQISFLISIVNPLPQKAKELVNIARSPIYIYLCKYLLILLSGDWA